MLKKGDLIRVIAPSMSAVQLGDSMILAREKLESLGFLVDYGKHIYESNEFLTTSIQNRKEDLENAFLDSHVKVIITATGGFQVNQILPYLDYHLIKENPTILCGYSDITALLNAIYTKTGMITYLGLHYSSFAMQKGFEYSLESFQKVLMENDCTLKASKEWSDEAWYLDQNHRHFYKNNGWKVYHGKNVEGILIGGNLNTFQLLQGTEYMPSLENKIILIEEDCEVAKEYSLFEFDRNLESLTQCIGFDKVKALLIGRMQKGSFITDDKLLKILESKQVLKHIPIMYNMDFGHTTPMMTLPIGGRVQVDMENKQLRILS